jgi:hypothetical protein
VSCITCVCHTHSTLLLRHALNPLDATQAEDAEAEQAQEGEGQQEADGHDMTKDDGSVEHIECPAPVHAHDEVNMLSACNAVKCWRRGCTRLPRLGIISPSCMGSTPLVHMMHSLSWCTSVLACVVKSDAKSSFRRGLPSDMRRGHVSGRWGRTRGMSPMWWRRPTLSALREETRIQIDKCADANVLMRA